MKQLTVCLLFLLVVGSSSFAQQVVLKGTVIDTSEKKNLSNSVISLLRASDSVLVSFVRSEKDGNFTLQKIFPGTYVLLVTHPSYADYADKIDIKENMTDLGTIAMILKSKLLEAVVVSHKLGAIRVKGDTVEYKADSFFMRPGSTVEDLLKKLPGIQVDRNGKITAQGETVQKVLVDGEEFFSDDPTIATRGLVSDAVDKVQVYDKKSDQAAFTGIDDGQKIKTIDLKLKEDRKKGYFGKIEAGSDASNYWNNNAMLNAFKGKRKFSAFGIMSNTGKTGLDWQERTNYGNNGNMEMNVEDGNIYISSSSGDEEFSSSYYGEGLPKGWSGGLHYSNKWNGDKLHLNGGYQFNKLNTAAEGSTRSQYILPDTLYYINENGKSFNNKYRNRFNGTYEAQVDSLASFKVTVDGAMGHTQAFGSNYSESLDKFGSPVNKSTRQTRSEGDNKTFNSSLLWKQKFKKTGRTLSVSLQQQYKNNVSDGFLLSTNEFYKQGSIDSTGYIDQQKLNDNTTSVLSGKVSYTEGLSKRSLLEFSYAINNSHRLSHRTTLAKLPNATKYEQEVDSLSNDYSFNVLTQQGGIAYRYARAKKLNFSVGINVSDAAFMRKDLRGDSTAAYHFTNFYPKLNATVNFTQNTSLRFNYNGRTRAPSIEQIQPVRDNTDPLNISIGNPQLKQAFEHRINMSFNGYNFLKEQYFYIDLNANTTQNDFSTISTVDTLGRRIDQPVNVQGNYSVSCYGSFNKSFKKAGIRLAFSGQFGKSRNNSFVNTLKNTTDSWSGGGGPRFSYEKDKKISISLETQFIYSNSKSSIRPDITNSFWTQEHQLYVLVYLPWKFEISSDCSFSLRQKTSTFDRNNNAIRWNGYLERKILKNNAATIKLSIYDMLNQNIGFNRDISSNFISERTYNTIQRYGMLSFLWNFNKNGKPQQW